MMKLLLAQAKRDRALLAVWMLGIALLGLAAASAVGSQFASEPERASIIAIAAASPAFLFLRGVPDGLSVGATVFFQAFAFTAVLAGLMSTFLVVRHSRADEELGRGELIGSTPVRRAAPLAATLALGLLANVVLVVLVAGAYVLAGLPVQGSVVAALAVGSVGAVFVGVGGVVAQVMPTGRGANGVAASAVGIAYLIRGIADALGTASADLTRVESSWLSWLSPIGWGQHARPFSEPTLAPLLVSLAVTSALCGIALVVRARRDLGASLVRDRSGAGRGKIGSAFGLAWRLQRSTLTGWCVGSGVLGAIAGGLSPIVADAVEGNDSLSALISSLVPGSSPNITDVFIAALVGMAGVLAAASGVQAIARLRAEEAEGRAELLLSTPVSRVRWLAAGLAVASISVVAVCASAGLMAGVAIIKTGGDASALATTLGAALAHAPAALVFVASTAVLLAVLPHQTIALGWGLLVIGLVLGQFGGLLNLPEWLQDVSPFHHSSALPVEELNVSATLTLVGVAAVGAVISAVMVRHRDLAS